MQEVVAKPVEDEGAAGGAAGGAQKKAKKIEILDGRRGQMISIMLSRFSKMTYAEIRKAIENVDEKVLDADNLGSLKQFVPAPDELAAIKECEDKDNLANPEKYLLEVSTVPLLAPRLE